jgi:hypothetical protein
MRPPQIGKAYLFPRDHSLFAQTSQGVEQDSRSGRKEQRQRSCQSSCRTHKLLLAVYFRPFFPSWASVLPPARSEKLPPPYPRQRPPYPTQKPERGAPLTTVLTNRPNGRSSLLAFSCTSLPRFARQTPITTGKLPDPYSSHATVSRSIARRRPRPCCVEQGHQGNLG